MKQCVLADNANQCFWWLFEYDGECDPKFANFDKELTKADFNCATVCNLCCPEGTWTLDKCVLKWEGADVDTTVYRRSSDAKEKTLFD